jgi:hypothetical protein
LGLDLKSGTFVPVSEKFMKLKLSEIQIQDIQKSQSENLFLELNRIIHELVRILDRGIFFFQGILTGISIMHLVVIYLNPDVY